MKNILLVLFLSIAIQHSFAATIYVKQNASGSNNGTNWANAFTSLQAGIAASTPGDQIWVAAGTYKPTTTTSQSVSFSIPSGVGIYGGFAGTETQLAQRDWATNQTVLSGDIGVTGTANDNSRHVVVANGVSANTRLDGFKIISGYAGDFINNNYYGGGMLVVNSSLTVANCLFTSNYSDNAGAGLAQSDYGGALTTGILNLINCSFTYNTGGALYLRGTQTNLTNCNISNNSGDEAIYINNGTAIFDRCVISGNNSTGGIGTIFVEDDGGVINVYNSLFAGNLSVDISALEIRYTSSNTHNIWNCTFAGNKSTGISSNEVIFLSPNANMRNCIVWGNYNNEGLALSNSDVSYCLIQGGYNGTGITSSNPLFVNPGNAGTAPFDASSYNYMLSSSSPAINTGNNTYTSNLYNRDLSDSARISAGTVDLGCYEKQYCSANVAITPSGATSFCAGSFVTLSASPGISYNWSNGATSQNTTVSTQGTYTVTVIDGNGCFGSASQLVNVYPASVQISGNTTVCNNTNTTLTATSANGNIFSWSNGQNGASITVTQAGSYSVTVTTLNSCTASAIVTVNAHTVVTPVITQTGNILTSNATTGNQWYVNGNIINGATSQNYTPTQSGLYTVIVTDGSGCSSNASNQINFTFSAIDEISKTVILIYPNPSNDIINVVFPDEMIGGTIFLNDITGKEIVTIPVTSPNCQINTTYFANGVYFFTVEIGSKKIIKKMVIEH